MPVSLPLTDDNDDWLLLVTTTGGDKQHAGSIANRNENLLTISCCIFFIFSSSSDILQRRSSTHAVYAFPVIFSAWKAELWVEIPGFKCLSRDTCLHMQRVQTIASNENFQLFNVQNSATWLRKLMHEASKPVRLATVRTVNVLALWCDTAGQQM